MFSKHSRKCHYSPFFRRCTAVNSGIKHRQWIRLLQLLNIIAFPYQYGYYFIELIHLGVTLDFRFLCSSHHRKQGYWVRNLNCEIYSLYLNTHKLKKYWIWKNACLYFSKIINDIIFFSITQTILHPWYIHLLRCLKNRIKRRNSWKIMKI